MSAAFCRAFAGTIDGQPAGGEWQPLFALQLRVENLVGIGHIRQFKTDMSGANEGQS